jgi:hypothetical protein
MRSNVLLSSEYAPGAGLPLPFIVKNDTFGNLLIIGAAILGFVSLSIFSL